MVTNRAIVHAIVFVAAAAAATALWAAWCDFPTYSWNELRLAPAFALRAGINPFPPVAGGPLSTWIYGPVGIVVNLPATLAGSAKTAVQTAGVINAFTVIAPMGVVFFAAKELRTRGHSMCLFALALGILLTSHSTLRLQVADSSAIACGILSCWSIARPETPTLRHMASAAGFCTLAIWAKQSEMFLAAAHIAYLAGQGGRRSCVTYIGLLLLGNGCAALLTGSAFGFSNVWLNTVLIPAKIPWADDIANRVMMHGLNLFLQIAAPAALLALLRRSPQWPSRATESGRLLLCATLTFVAMLPIGLAALFKFGGNLNVLHSWAYLLPAGVLTLLVTDPIGTMSYRTLAAIGVALAVNAGQLKTFTAMPRTSAYDHAARITAAYPGRSWFPNNPLITFYADQRLWHTQDGIVTRNLAGYGLRKPDFLRHLPPVLRVIVYPAGTIFPISLQLLPEYHYRIAGSHWDMYCTTAPGPDQP